MVSLTTLTCWVGRAHLPEKGMSSATLDGELLNTPVSTSNFSQTFDSIFSFHLESPPGYYSLFTEHTSCILNEVIDLSICAYICGRFCDVILLHAR